MSKQKIHKVINNSNNCSRNIDAQVVKACKNKIVM